MPALDHHLPVVSIVILNYNGMQWLKPCISSLRSQTIIGQLEIIIADNASTDGSDKLSEELVADFGPRGKFLQNGKNLGFCEGNNRGAALAAGKWLFFLNNDTWLEPDCMEKLLTATEAAHAQAAGPLVLNYDGNSFQSLGARGFDIFGFMSTVPSKENVQRVFAVPGCSLLISTSLFRNLGGFDSGFFMYSDEIDLAWRVALSGGLMISVPQSRLHHRSSAASNPKGGGRIIEWRTTDFVRYLSNRNSLLLLLKNAQHILLLLVVTQIMALMAEALLVACLTRDWKLIRQAYLRAVLDCYRMRQHVLAERERIRAIRRVNDFQMIRFLRIRLSRFYYEGRKLLAFGAPRIGRRGAPVPGPGSPGGTTASS